MSEKYSIKSLYPLALAEGEGVGTAYEYYAKRRQLARWLQREKDIQRILIAGLPEKYGASLDFMLLASEYGASLTIVDNRQLALDKAAEALRKSQANGFLRNLQPEYIQIDHMGSLGSVDGFYDLALSSETIQRLTKKERVHFMLGLLRLTPLVTIFTPNDENPAHTSQSGLSGVRLAELEDDIGQALDLLQNASTRAFMQTGYIDLPPFPPGITRTDEQRQHATSGKGEAIAMWGLGYYARLEPMIPLRWRRKYAHIVFALIKISQR